VRGGAYCPLVSIGRSGPHRQPNYRGKERLHKSRARIRSFVRLAAEQSLPVHAPGEKRKCIHAHEDDSEEALIARFC
jgi:hypothetical protein